MSVLSRFRLDGGTNQQAARKLLPTEGLLRRVQNLRLRRDNELGVRPGFSAFGTSVYGQGSATLSVYDVCSYDERLFAFGSMSTSPLVNGFYEYVGEVKAWRQVLPDLPDATNVREVGMAPDTAGSVDCATVAAHDGIVVLAIGTLGGAFSLDAFAHVFRAADDVTLVHQLLSATAMVKPVALVTESGKFHVVGAAPSSTLGVMSFTPASGESFATLVPLDAIGAGGKFSAAAVLGTPGGYVVVAQQDPDGLIVSSYDDSHNQLMTRTITGIATNYLSVHANGPQDSITLAYVNTSDLKVYTYSIVLSTGVDILGPNGPISAATAGYCSVRYESSANTTFYLGIYDTGASFGPHLNTSLFHVGNSTPFGSGSWTDAILSTDIAVGPAPSRLQGGANRMLFAGFIVGPTGGKIHAMGNLREQSPIWYQDFGTANGDSGSRLGGLVQDAVTGLWYSTRLVLGNDLQIGVATSEWAHGARTRRQTAVAANLLYVSGGLPLVFDGQQIVEVSWGEPPIVEARSSTTGGSLTSSAEYFFQFAFEWLDSRRNVHRSPPSLVRSLTLGASDTKLVLTVSSGHSLRARIFATLDTPGSSFRLSEFRTAALVDLSAGENLYRETYQDVAPGSFGGRKTFDLISSDDDLRALGATQGTIYTQGQTFIPDQAPPPCRYLWPTNERLAAAGLPRGEQWIQSKLRFPGEAMAFADSDLPEFSGNADETILAIGALSGSLVAFTRKSISLWQGEGPDFTGQGSFSFAGLLGKEGGIKSWQSLCDTDEGLYFRRDDDQICMIDKTHGTLSWTVGQAVRDELALYPNVVAAVHLRREHAVVFAVQNDAGNAGELLVLDLRRKQWFIDDVLAVALAEYQGRLVYVDPSGTCHYQDASPGVGAMPNQTFETFDFDFGSGLGWGEIINVGIVGTKVADCVGTLDVTYDSGASYTTIGSWTLSTANGYASGGLLQLKKAPPLRRCSRFGLRFNVTGGSDTEGVRVNEITLETEAAPGMARLPVRDTQ